MCSPCSSDGSPCRGLGSWPRLLVGLVVGSPDVAGRCVVEAAVGGAVAAVPQVSRAIAAFLPWALRCPRLIGLAGLAAPRGEGERMQLVRVGDEIDSGDAAAGDGEGDDGDRILGAAEQ